MVRTTKKQRAKIQGYLSNPAMAPYYSQEELKYTILVLNLIITELTAILMMKQKNEN